MADLSKTIEIIFAGKDDVSKSIKSISSGIDDFSGKIGTATQPLADLTKDILSANAALAALAIGGMAYAISKSSEFNESFALISTSVSASGEDLAKYRDDILDYSTTSVKSLGDINASLYTAAQAGIKYTDSLGFIAKAEELAVANKADLNTTVDLLTGTMNAYGFKMSDLAHINDVFFQSTLIGKQTIDELGGSMGNVVGIAANSGVSFEELSAAIATLTAKGVGTEEAITQVKGVITSIISPSKEAADAAKALGLNFSLTELNSKGFSTLLSEIMTKTGGSKEKMVELFSEVRAMNGVLQLTGDGMTFFNSALDQVTNSTGASEAAYKKMAETFSAQSQMVMNQAQVALIAVGTELEPMAAKISAGFGGILSGVKIALDAGAFDPVFNMLDSFASSIAATLANIAKNMPEALAMVNFDKLTASFSNLGASLKGAFESIFGDIDLNTPEGLAKGIQKVVDGIAALDNVTAGIIKSFGPFLELIRKGIEEFSNADSSTQELTGKFLGFVTQLNMVVDNIGLLTGALQILAGATSVNAALGLGKMLSGSQALTSGLSVLGAQVTTTSQLLGGGGLAFAAGYAIGEVLRLIPGVDEAAQGFAGWTDKLFNWTGTQKEANVITDEMAERIRIGNERLAEMRAATDTAKQGVDEYGVSLSKVPEIVKTEIKIDATGKDAEEIKQILNGDYRLDPLIQAITIIPPEETKLVAAQQVIEEKIPKIKEVEIQAKLDEAKIKAQADIIQSAIEWKAKIDIAEIEAGAEKIKAAFASVDNTISSAGTSISDLFKTLAGEDLQSSAKWKIEEAIEKQQKMQEDAAELQKDLTKEQIEYLRAKTAAMARGDAMITIDGAGLQPHLEAFMFEILSAIQIRANAEGANFLVGL